jgi:hypothetical protein
MEKKSFSPVGRAKTLSFNQETRNQPKIADLKNRVLAEFGRWLDLDSRVPPIRKLYHPVAQTLAAGQLDHISFAAAEQYAISNSIWLESKAVTARDGLNETAFLKLLASNFAEQARLLEMLLPVVKPL